MSKFAEPLQKFLADLPEKDEDDILAGIYKTKSYNIRISF